MAAIFAISTVAEYYRFGIYLRNHPGSDGCPCISDPPDLVILKGVVIMFGTISVSRSDYETVISIKGRFNFEMHPQFRAAYKEDEREKNPNRRFIVDLAGAEYLDSSALGMLLLLRELTDSDYDNLEIVNSPPEVRKILETANFDRLFKIT